MKNAKVRTNRVKKKKKTKRVFFDVKKHIGQKTWLNN